jgi:hypothetical protein
MSVHPFRTVLLAAALILPAAAQAAIVAVTSRAGLGANDLLAWNAMGIVQTPMAPDPGKFLSNSFTAYSAAGLGVDVSIPATAIADVSAPLVFQTGIPQTGRIPTNFAADDYILFTGNILSSQTPPTPGNSGTLSLHFDKPVYGAGAQIAVDDLTTAYTVAIDIYGMTSQLLGTFTASASSLGFLNNTATFLGVRSDTRNIGRIDYRYEYSALPDQGFGINQLSLAVPEPDGIFGFGLAVLIARRLAARARR